jgi:hypothetical protein
MNASDITIELPPFFLNQSRWKAFQDCDRLYAWSEIERLEPNRLRRPLEIGTAIHNAMVAVHEHENPGSAEAFAVATEAAKQHLRERWKDAPKLMGDELAVNEDAELIGRLLPAYHRHYSSMGQVWKPLGQEIAFKVEVGEGTGIYLVGRLDNLVTFMGGLWMVDYKTMGRLDTRDFTKYDMDIQVTAYIYGGTKQLSLDSMAKGGKPIMIKGAIIDGLIKTIVPQFHRDLFTRTVDDLRNFEIEFCQKAWEIAAKHAIVNHRRDMYDIYTEKIWNLGQEHGWKATFPKNTNNCFRYGTCAFRDLCVNDTEVRRMAFTRKTLDYVDEAAGKGKAER